MFGREPVAIATAIRAVILCFVAFGLKWTPEQIAAVMLAVEAVLAVITRQSVTPNANVALTVDKKVPVVLLMAALGASVLLTACSMSARHTAVVADVSVHSSLAALQDGEMALYQAGELAPNDAAANKALHQRINKALVPALKSEDAFNRLVRNWQPGQPAPAELQQHVADMRALFNEISAAMPDGVAKSKLLAWVTVAQNAALAVIVNLPAK